MFILCSISCLNSLNDRDSGGPVFEERDGTPEGDLLMAVISGGAQG
jgi:hypothetical protein